MDTGKKTWAAAVNAAVIIMNDRETLRTAYGKKRLAGIADIIHREVFGSLNDNLTPCAIHGMIAHDGDCPRC